MCLGQRRLRKENNVPSACFKMGENACWKLWVRLGCSPRYTQIVPEWDLAGQLAGSHFFNTCTRRDAQTSSRFRREFGVSLSKNKCEVTKQ